MNEGTCLTTKLIPPPNFIKCNCSDDYKNEILIDTCLAEEIKYLWEHKIRTTGCCCGHRKQLGFIQVIEEDIPKMYELGYQNYIYDDEFGGINRIDAFIPKSTLHIIDIKKYSGSGTKEEIGG